LRFTQCSVLSGRSKSLEGKLGHVQAHLITGASQFFDLSKRPTVAHRQCRPPSHLPENRGGAMSCQERRRWSPSDYERPKKKDESGGEKGDYLGEIS